MTEHDLTILDHRVLAELSEDLEEDFEGFVRTFLSNARQSMAAMNTACGRNDPEEVGRLAHSLKGTAGYLGASGLSARLDVLQRLGKTCESAGMATELAAISTDFETLETQLLDVLSPN